MIVISADLWIIKDNNCHPLVFGQWETNILLKNRNVFHPVPLAHSLKYLNLLAHRRLSRDRFRFIFYVLRENYHSTKIVSFNIENEHVCSLGKSITLDMFVGRNRKFEYASNTAGHRLWWVFIKKLEAEKIPEQTFNIKGKPGLAAPGRSLKEQAWSGD